jgi:hypothetical protein
MPFRPVPHRIYPILVGTERPPCIGNRLAKLQKRDAYLLEARLIPVGDFECAGTLLVYRERFLQGVDLLDILRLCRIDQHAHHDDAISRTDPFLCQGVPARAIVDRRGVLVLIDDLHHHETIARIGQRDRHRTGVEVEHRERIQRVTVGPNYAPAGDRRQLAAMPELAKGARFNRLAKIDV